MVHGCSPWLIVHSLVVDGPLFIAFSVNDRIFYLFDKTNLRSILQLAAVENRQCEG